MDIERVAKVIERTALRRENNPYLSGGEALDLAIAVISEVGVPVTVFLPQRVVDYIGEAITEALIEMVDADREAPER